MEQINIDFGTTNLTVNFFNWKEKLQSLEIVKKIV